MSKRYIVREEDGSRVYTGEDSTEHVLYEGDNLHSLEMIQESHEGKIDVIYIDPPYNTGNTGFVYNDRFKVRGDEDRHTRWLAFMEKRLRLARELMVDDGVIFISIDDNELYQLKLLCDQIFGGENFIANLIWKKSKGTGRKNVGTISVENEYLVTYAKDKGKVGRLEVPKKVPKSMSNPDNDPRGEWFSGSISSPITNRDAKNVYTINIEGNMIERRWFRDKEDIEKLVEEDKIYVPIKRDGEIGTPRLKMFKEDFLEETMIASNLLIDIEGATTTDGKITLQELGLDRWFDYPKPVELIKHVLSMVQNKNATILDFFAGSGTTAHAVVELNREDGGNRKAILMTNNEINYAEEEDFLVEKGFIEPFTGSRRGTKKHTEWLESVNEFKETEEYKELTETDEYKNLGVARRVTRERVRKVIEGYTTPRGKEVEGLDGNNFRHYVVSE